MFIINFFSLIIILIIHILLFNYTFVSSKRQKRVIDNNDISYYLECIVASKYYYNDKSNIYQKLQENIVKKDTFYQRL